MKKLFLEIIIFLLFFLVWACGKKGPPRAPEDVYPRAIKDLTAGTIEEGIELDWTIPHRNVDGSQLRDLKEFQILRCKLTLIDEKIQCSSGYKLIKILSMEVHPPEGERRSIRFRDRDVPAGLSYNYKVISCNRDGYCSKDSNVVTIELE